MTSIRPAQMRLPAVTANAASGTTQALTFLPLGPGQLVLLSIGTSATAKTVSSIAVTSGTGTFTNVNAKNGTGVRSELWIGRNFGSYPTGATVTFAQSTGAHCVVAEALDVSSDLSSAPTLNSSGGSSGTSTTADTGLYATPNIDDLCVGAAVWANGTASSARSGSPTDFVYNTEVASSSTIRVALAWLIYEDAFSNASQVQWTISNVAWAATMGNIALAADPSAATGKLVKGRTTATADAAATA